MSLIQSTGVPQRTNGAPRAVPHILITSALRLKVKFHTHTKKVNDCIIINEWLRGSAVWTDTHERRMPLRVTAVGSLPTCFVCVWRVVFLSSEKRSSPCSREEAVHGCCLFTCFSVSILRTCEEKRKSWRTWGGYQTRVGSSGRALRCRSASRSEIALTR
jgi:hypothetical protein